MSRCQTIPISMKVLGACLVSLMASICPPSLKATAEGKTLPKNNNWQKLMDTGEASFQLGKYDDAENQFASAACSEQNTEANDLHIAMSLMRQADACCKEERFATADRLYAQALKIREKKLGANHFDVMEVLKKQAALEERHKNYLVAEQLYKRVADCNAKISGAESPQVALLLKNIAHCKYRNAYELDPQPGEPRKNPKYLESERLLNRALKIYDRETPNNLASADVLDELGSMYWEFREFSKGEQCYRRALQIRDSSLNHNDSSIAANLTSLIGISTRQSKDAQAKPWYQRLLAIWKSEPANNEIGSDKKSQTIRLNNRGVMCLNMGDFEEAKSYFEKALRIDPNYKLCSENLAIVRKRMKEQDKK